MSIEANAKGNGNQAIAPPNISASQDFLYQTDELNVSQGLTKREEFASRAMQGFCANSEINQGDSGDMEWKAQRAVRQADALLEALEEK